MGRRQRSKQLKKHSEMEQSLEEDDDDEHNEAHQLHAKISNAESFSTSYGESDGVDGRYLNYDDGRLKNVNSEMETEDFDRNLSLTVRTSTSYGKHTEYEDANKYGIFERLPKDSCRKSFCCADDKKSKNSKRYCRYCRNDMRLCDSGNIDDYFDLFRYHGQILDEVDIKDMKRLCDDYDYVHLCPHCFRPYILWSENDSNRHSRFQIMLEIISFYVFIVFMYSKCKGFTKPKAFTGEDVLADIGLYNAHQANTRHVVNVIKKTIKQKKTNKGFNYMQLSASPTAEEEAGIIYSSNN